MKIVTNIETGLSIDYPLDVYSDARTNLLDMVSEIFQGRCSRKCRIEEVRRIVNVSPCEIHSRGSQSFGVTYVTFEVLATVYTAGEVINGCVVKHKDRGIIVASHETASIWLKAHPSLEGVRIGQMISVVVGEVTYEKGLEKISVNAIPYIPEKLSKCYRIEGSLSPGDREFLNAAFERMQQEEELYAADKNKKGLEFFSGLIRPYRDSPKTPSGAKKESLKSLLDKGKFSGWYCRDKSLVPVEPQLYVYGNAPKSSETAPITVVDTFDIRNAVLALIEDYTSSLRIVRELNEVYNTPDLVKGHMNVFRIFHKVK